MMYSLFREMNSSSLGTCISSSENDIYNNTMRKYGDRGYII